MPSEATNEATRQEWRELGFYYDQDDEAKEWRIMGSCSGLLRLRDLLLEYAVNPRKRRLSEHEHYGPYMYLKIMTWAEPGIDRNAIYGTPADLQHLAEILGAKLAESPQGTVIRIGEEFSPSTSYELAIHVCEEDFDPASLNPLLPEV